MHFFRIIFVITFICFPSYTYSDNACMEKAKKELEKCLERRPEREWGICEQQYYKAIAKCR